MGHLVVNGPIVYGGASDELREHRGMRAGVQWIASGVRFVLRELISSMSLLQSAQFSEVEAIIGGTQTGAFKA